MLSPAGVRPMRKNQVKPLGIGQAAVERQERDAVMLGDPADRGRARIRETADQRLGMILSNEALGSIGGFGRVIGVVGEDDIQLGAPEAIETAALTHQDRHRVHAHR